VSAGYSKNHYRIAFRLLIIASVLVSLLVYIFPSKARACSAEKLIRLTSFLRGITFEGLAVLFSEGDIGSESRIITEEVLEGKYITLVPPYAYCMVGNALVFSYYVFPFSLTPLDSREPSDTNPLLVYDTSSQDFTALPHWALGLKSTEEVIGLTSGNRTSIFFLTMESVPRLDKLGPARVFDRMHLYSLDFETLEVHKLVTLDRAIAKSDLGVKLFQTANTGLSFTMGTVYLAFRDGSIIKYAHNGDLLAVMRIALKPREYLVDFSNVSGSITYVTYAQGMLKVFQVREAELLLEDVTEPFYTLDGITFQEAFWRVRLVPISSLETVLTLPRELILLRPQGQLVLWSGRPRDREVFTVMPRVKDIQVITVDCQGTGDLELETIQVPQAERVTLLPPLASPLHPLSPQVLLFHQRCRGGNNAM